SHIYETKCKEGLNPKGIELLKEAKKITDIKIIALGGILPSNVDPLVNSTLLQIGQVLIEATNISPIIMGIILGGLITVVGTS
ncbi:thiamine phosphate synthase, partial [Clostridioides difficile]